MTKAFDDFLASAKEVSCEEFYASRIARESCVDSSWFVNDKYKPLCFIVLDDEQWFAKFNISDQATYYTVVEKEERWGSLESLAKWVFDWLQEEYGE